MSNLRRKHLITTGKLVLAAGLLYWLQQKGAIDLGILLRYPASLFLACFGLTAFGIAMNTGRWFLLLREKQIPCSFGQALVLSFLGLFWNFAMPGGVGGDAIKVLYLFGDSPYKKAEILSTIVIDRFIGLLSMVIVAVTVSVFYFQIMSSHPRLVPIFTGVMLLGLGFIALCWVLFVDTGRIRPILQKLSSRAAVFRKIERLYGVTHEFGRRPLVLLQTLGMSFITQASTVLLFYIVGRYQNEDIPLSAYLMVVPLGLVASALPLSPAGIGVGQAAFYVLFQLYLGRSVATGATAFTIIQLIQLILGIIGFGLHTFWIGKRKTVPSVTDH